MTKFDHLIDQLYHSEYQKLYFVAVQLVSDPNRAEDVVQETFYAATQRKEDLAAHPNPTAWLYDALKKKAKVNNQLYNQLMHWCISYEEVFSDGKEQAGFDRSNELSELLAQFGSVLNRDEIYILKRIVIDGARSAEAAKELHIAASTCQKRLERIREKLQRHFPEYAKGRGKNKKKIF